MLWVEFTVHPLHVAVIVYEPPACAGVSNAFHPGTDLLYLHGAMCRAKVSMLPVWFRQHFGQSGRAKRRARSDARSKFTIASSAPLCASSPRDVGAARVVAKGDRAVHLVANGVRCMWCMTRGECMAHFVAKQGRAAHAVTRKESGACDGQM
jgi:hypothetical protein